MDEIRIRELPQKGSAISLSDLIIIEDEDGTKTIESSAFKSLIQQSLFFDTVEDMKSATLRENDIVRTLGYRNINDGGGAYYLITYAPTDVEDGIYIHYLHTSDTLRAHYIRDTSDINISQAGAYGDGVNDDFTIIQRMLNKGTMVAVPRKTYKVSGSLDVLSNTTIDLNGATIICNSAAAFTIGLDHEARNITIKNGKFIGINGIELYTMASEITISNCEFYGSDDIVMSKAILINGASNVQIDNIKIGSLGKGEVRYGIYISNGTGEDGEAHLNYNVQMSNLSIIASMAGIDFSGTYVDKNISVVDFSVEGFYNDRTDKEMYGVIVGSNADSISLSNGKIRNTNAAIAVTGIISATIALTDIMADDCDIMYNFASAGSTINMYGLHRFTGNGLGTAYVFDRITSKIVIQGEFDADRETSKLAGLYKTSMVGDLVDVVSPIGRKKINVVSLEKLNDTTSANTIPGYKNISLNLQFSGTVKELKFPSLSGQVIALYADTDDCVLSASTKLRIPSDITLSRYEPVVLLNTSGVWSMVQFGGSSDGTTGGGGSGSSGGTITTLDALTIYLGDGSVNKYIYDGTSPKEIRINPANIGASASSHKHGTNDIIGYKTIPESLKNPFKLIINNGSDELEYDGSSEVTIDISGAGSSSGGTVDLSGYAKKNNLTGTGSISINRSSTEIGTNSVSLGSGNTATKNSAVALGFMTTASGDYATAIGYTTTASGESALAKGSSTVASGLCAEASGKDTIASGNNAFTMGLSTIATGNNQLVLGRYNKADTNYVLIVGGGSANTVRSNIYTLDWNGNAIYTGTVSASEPVNSSDLTTKHYVDAAGTNLENKIKSSSNDMKEYVDNINTNLQSSITSLSNTSATTSYVDAADKKLDEKITKLDSSSTSKTYVDNADTALENKITEESANMKTYVDNADTALENKITDIISTIALLTSGLKGFNQTGYEVTDWNDIDSNGFVYTNGYTFNESDEQVFVANCPKSCKGNKMVGIAMLSFLPAASDETTKTIIGGYVFAFDVDNIYSYNSDNTMCIPMYVRAYVAGDSAWDDWVKLSVGTGDYDL